MRYLLMFLRGQSHGRVLETAQAKRAAAGRADRRGSVDETTLLLEFLEHNATDALETAYGSAMG